MYPWSMDDAPDVFAHLDHRRFLEAWFEWKKRSNPRYSHRAFARRAGFGSPSLLHLVIKGERNITDGTLPGFLKALGLTGEARRHFGLLVQLDRAEGPTERDGVYQAIRASAHFRAANRLEDGAYTYLSDWTLPVIRELAGAPGFRFDPVWVAGRLRPPITEAHARRSLQTLVELGMLEVDGEEVRLREVAVVTPHEVAGPAVFRYHQGMLERAVHALEHVPGAERHFGAVTVRVPADQVSLLKEEVAAFQERLLALCDALPSEPGPQRVMQVDLQLFPLTEDVGC